MVLAGAVSPTQSNLEGAVGDVVTEVSQTWGLTSSGLFTLGLLSRGPQSLSSAAPGADEACKPGLHSRPAGFSHVQPCVCGERLTHRSTLEHKVGGAGPGRVRALRSPSARRALLTPEPPGPWAPVIPAHGGCASLGPMACGRAMSGKTGVGPAVHLPPCCTWPCEQMADPLISHSLGEQGQQFL